MLRWKREGKEFPKYPEMIPAKVKDEVTNNFFANYVFSCLAVLEAAFAVPHWTFRN
jgi:hypothetical protein